MELNRAIICEFTNERMIFSLLIDFSSFTNFFAKVSKTKSKRIRKESPNVIQILSLSCFFLFEPALAYITSEG